MKKFLRGLLTWQAVGPFVIYVLLVLFVALYIALIVSLNNASHSLHLANRSSNRISSLQVEINKLEHHLRTSQVHDAKKRGQLENAIRALAAQIRQLGGQPVVTFPITSDPESQPSPHSSSSASARKPSPKPKPTSTSSPSPTSSPLACVTTIDHSFCIH